MMEKAGIHTRTKNQAKKQPAHHQHLAQYLKKKSPPASSVLLPLVLVLLVVLLAAAAKPPSASGPPRFITLRPARRGQQSAAGVAGAPRCPMGRTRTKPAAAALLLLALRRSGARRVVDAITNAAKGRERRARRRRWMGRTLGLGSVAVIPLGVCGLGWGWRSKM